MNRWCGERGGLQEAGLPISDYLSEEECNEYGTV